MSLTTGRAPVIEQARAAGRRFIEQPYALYSRENHTAWRRLFERQLPSWRQYANPHFLHGLESLCLDPCHVPRLDEVNRFLAPRTGFVARGVSGYLPAFPFFDCLRQRTFPTTVTLRDSRRLDYLPEPDIFHDIAGHVPMHTDPAFAEALVRFGDCAHAAAERAAGTDRAPERRQRLASMIRAMARFFWFTVEFGLMQGEETEGTLKVYGSGLLSSHGEIIHAIESRDVHRHPIRLEWVIHQGFAIDRYQPLLFIVESFSHLYALAGELEQWMREGRLDHVAPGDPPVSEEDLFSFMTPPADDTSEGPCGETGGSPRPLPVGLEPRSSLIVDQQEE